MGKGPGQGVQVEELHGDKGRAGKGRRMNITNAGTCRSQALPNLPGTPLSLLWVPGAKLAHHATFNQTIVTHGIVHQDSQLCSVT